MIPHTAGIAYTPTAPAIVPGSYTGRDTGNRETGRKYDPSLLSMPSYWRTM
ncbi:hypothetical protein [Methanospirillum sp.]